MTKFKSINETTKMLLNVMANSIGITATEYDLISFVLSKGSYDNSEQDKLNSIRDKYYADLHLWYTLKEHAIPVEHVKSNIHHKIPTRYYLGMDTAIGVSSTQTFTINTMSNNYIY